MWPRKDILKWTKWDSSNRSSLFISLYYGCYSYTYRTFDFHSNLDGTIYIYIAKVKLLRFHCCILQTTNTKAKSFSSDWNKSEKQKWKAREKYLLSTNKEAQSLCPENNLILNVTIVRKCMQIQNHKLKSW